MICRSGTKSVLLYWDRKMLSQKKKIDATLWRLESPHHTNPTLCPLEVIYWELAVSGGAQMARFEPGTSYMDAHHHIPQRQINQDLVYNHQRSSVLLLRFACIINLCEYGEYAPKVEQKEQKDNS